MSKKITKKYFNKGCVYESHGLSGTPEHKIWKGITKRCYNPKCAQYDDYGGRGIGMCDRWQGPAGFTNFLSDMGPRPSPKHSIDRIDNNKGYGPENCRWATRSEQARNKRNNRMFTINGKTQTISAWCEELNLKYHTVYGRFYRTKSSADIFRPMDNKTHCKNGHKYTKENLYFHKAGKNCKKCIAIKRKMLKEFTAIYADPYNNRKFMAKWVNFRKEYSD